MKTTFIALFISGLLFSNIGLSQNPSIFYELVTKKIIEKKDNIKGSCINSEEYKGELIIYSSNFDKNDPQNFYVIFKWPAENIKNVTIAGKNYKFGGEFSVRYNYDIVCKECISYIQYSYHKDTQYNYKLSKAMNTILECLLEYKLITRTDADIIWAKSSGLLY